MATHTKQDIAKVLDSTERTIRDDSSFLLKQKLINPTIQSGRATLYSNQDLDMFRQLRNHCREGNGRKSFAPTKQVEVMTGRPTPKRIKSITQNPAAEELGYLRRSNPFFLLEILEKLQKIADQKWLIPTGYLAELFGISPKTLSRYQSYSYWGFVASKETKVVHKLNNYQAPTEDNINPVGLIVTRKVLWKLEANNQ